MNVLDIIRGGAQIGAGGYAGYAQDEKVNVARLLAEQKAAQDARNNAVLNRVRLAGIDPALQGQLEGAKAGARVKAETPELVNRQRLQIPVKVAEQGALLPGEVAKAKQTAEAVSPITTQTAVNTHQQERTFDNAHPAPVQPGFSPVVTTTPSGEQHVSRFNTKTGAIEDTGVGAKAGSGASIPAGIRTKVAENESTLATIGEALKSLDAHPDAVGLDKNLPLVGKYVDQRVDPEGVATRALIANVGSLQIHTRTGANMNIREEPRLAPFVPDASDTPEAIKTKLNQLAQFLNVETDALVSGPATTRTPNPSAPKATPAAATGGSRAQQLWDAAVAKYGEAKVLHEYGPRPPA